MKTVSWKDVFHSHNLSFLMSAYEMNHWIGNNTFYPYFMFNDVIYRVSPSFEFSLEYNKTELRVRLEDTENLKEEK